MTILALDLGTKTGYAFGDLGSMISGTQNFTPSRFDSSSMRYLRMERWLDDMDTSRKVDHIVFEEVRAHAGTIAAQVYGGFFATLATWAERHHIPMEPYSVGEVKKFWTGKGNANKDAMIAKAKEMGYDPVDDNEADAIAMWHMAVGTQ